MQRSYLTLQWHEVEIKEEKENVVSVKFVSFTKSLQGIS